MLGPIQLAFWWLMQIQSAQSLLYPKESLTREVKSLDGIWKFRLSPSLQPQFGFENHHFNYGCIFDTTDSMQYLQIDRVSVLI